jgi:hypothetical protein
VIGRRLQSHARRHSVRRVAGRHRPVACATRTGTLIWKYRASSPAPGLRGRSFLHGDEN